MCQVHRNAVVAASTLVLALTCLARAPAAGDGFVSLSHLAPRLGYTYSWIASEAAVALTRPGLYILVRTGNPLYDVNDAVETTSKAPQFRNNDIFVSPSMVTRLRSLAENYTLHGRRAPSDPPAIGVAGPLQGTLTLLAVPADGSDLVLVSGTGPANVPLTISLSADISRDLPRVTLSRTSVDTDAAGKFSVQMSTAPLGLERSIVHASATSLPGVSGADTSFVLGRPSPNIAHPVDELPRDFRPHI